MSKISLNPPGLDFIDYRDPIWGDSYNWSWNRSLNQVDYLVIHHTVTPHDATPDDIALLHKARGWGGVGYHAIITQDGTVYYVGDIGTARANVKDKNEKVIGIALIGDFTQHLPSDAQIVSAHKFCQFLIENYPALENIDSWESVLVGHKDLQATACPGTSWGSSSPDNMKWRIMTGTPYTAQEEEVDWKKRHEELDKKTGSWEETTTLLTTFRQGLAEALGVADDETKIKAAVKELVDKEDIQEKLRTNLNNIFAKLVKVVGIEGFQKAWTESTEEEVNMVLSEFEKTSGRLTTLQNKVNDLTTEKEKLEKKLKSIKDKRASELLSLLSSILTIIKEAVKKRLLPEEGGEEQK